MITLEDFIQLYDGSACLTIDGFCDEMRYDYYMVPDDPDDLSADNPNHYQPTCLALEPWWPDVRFCYVKSFKVLPDDGCYSTELIIHLEED